MHIKTRLTITSGQKKIEIAAHPSGSIWMLKHSRSRDVEGIAQGQQQQLVFGGKQLDDSRTLGGHYSTTKGSVVFVLVRPVGHSHRGLAKARELCALCPALCTHGTWRPNSNRRRRAAAERQRLARREAGRAEAAAAANEYRWL
jgi:hypothetical protein